MQKLGQVEVRLQQRRPRPPCEECLGPVDHAAEEGGKDQRRHRLEQRREVTVLPHLPHQQDQNGHGHIQKVDLHAALLQPVEP